MPDYTLTRPELFPDGTSVGAYLADKLPAGLDAPTGTPVQTQTASGGSVAYTALPPAIYVAYGQVGGVWRSIRFTVEPGVQPVDAAGGVLSGVYPDPGFAVDMATQAELNAEATTRAAADSTHTAEIAAHAADLAVIKEAPLNVKYPEFGAVGDNSTDDTAAIQSAIDAITQGSDRRGGDIFFPGSVYKVDSGLSFDGLLGIRLIGEGGRLPRSAVTLNYTASGTTPLISGVDCANPEFHNLRLVPSNAGFTGDFLNLDGVTADVGGVVMEDCQLGRHDEDNNARSLLRLNKAIICNIRNNSFAYGDTAIRAGDPNYAVSVNIIDGNTFNFQHDAQIVVGPTEALKIDGNTFESLSNGKAGAIDRLAGDYYQRGLNILNNWFGDASGTPGFWVNCRPLGAMIAGNRMAYSGSGANDYAIGLAGNSVGATIVGNDIASAYGVQFEPDPGSNGYVYNTTILGGDWTVDAAGQEIANLSSSLSHVITAGTVNNVKASVSFTRGAFSDGVVTKEVGAAINDGYFDYPAVSGLMAVDSANNRLYVRVGSTWKYVALT